ncbi:MAG: hypothetical protein N4A49_05445 [Marinifilaceae bacterium]|jgi:DNA-directed RNA polymerase subunit RPC12/RpoP|nr:hypothetical protein [Marinifilaceae bacterium]
MEEIKEQELKIGTFKCTDCGADLKYKPGTEYLNCEYCGANNEIPHLEEKIEELDFFEFLNKKAETEETSIERYVKCESCGASSTLEPNISSAFCPYCSTPLVIEHAHDEKIIQPKSLLPFKMEINEAKAELKKWINGLWFAPGDLKKASLNFDHFKGVYVPYWTFDTNFHTEYIGQRGIYYYETQHYGTTEGGEEVKKEVRKTRWYSTSGSILGVFDDILTVATKSLPEKYINKLEPWDLENLVPYDKSYLSGFLSEKYQIGLEEGFNKAQEIIEPKIQEMIKQDIGGDEQRILKANTNYNNITFKHLLLPVFISSYKYKGKLYQSLINARTGEIQGQRPYSAGKIILTIILIVAIITTIIYFSQ